MPTSHRAERSTRQVLPWLIPLLVVAVIAAGVGIAVAVGGSGDKSPSTAPKPTPTSTPSASPTVAPATTPASPTSTPTATPTKKHSPKPPAITAVPASAPHAITIGTAVVDAGFGNALTETRGYLFPDGATEMQRLSSRGTPGSPGTDTVIVVGAANDHGTGVLDRLDQVRTGERVVLTTRTGTLTYRITELVHANPNAVLTLPQVRAHVPGRLVIDRANYVNHNRSGQDLVVIAQLVKAESLRP